MLFFYSASINFIKDKINIRNSSSIGKIMTEEYREIKCRDNSYLLTCLFREPVGVGVEWGGGLEGGGRGRRACTGEYKQSDRGW